jgi:diguanylate cyclase (GGDEF)-like protein/PAS domain S-box-containing protein
MGRSLNVLLVEDSADDAELLELELSRGGLSPAIRRVETAEAMRAALAEADWDVVLCDYNLPSFSADGALTTLQDSGHDLPFIILSGVVQSEDAVTLLKRGAHDFLNKDSLARLVPAIQREIREAVERTQRRRAEERVRILSLAVEQSPVSVVITDRDGAIEYVNPKFQAITGYSLFEAVGRNLDFTCLDMAGQEIFRTLWATVLDGQEWRGEFCNRRRDGGLFWEHATVSPLKDKTGAITHFVAVKEDITVRRSYEERLLRQANFDELTGLPNRVLMLDRLEQAIAVAHRHDTLTALLYIDLDQFKNVNDTLGHVAGDRLLKEASARLGECTREGDTLARMGGDEFVIILPGISSGRAAQKVAERVITLFNQPFVLEGQDNFVTASLGITLFPGDGADGQVLLRNADLAMYKAKELGRNGYHFFTPEINARMQARLALEGKLRGAVGRDELLLHYQPIIGLKTNTPIALEALMRWRQPNGGLLMPGHFISVAEEVGLIKDMGDWVVATACRQLSKLVGSSASMLRMAVNVSPRQLQIEGFGAYVARLLSEYALSPECLELEITESVLMDDTPETAVNLKQLCDLGVRLSIDDFGTGYSSLGYLQRYPFDTLKIDRSFISAALDNPNAGRLVETIIGMAHGLGLEVIAEGVETVEQLAFLRERECDNVQGFLFSRPVPPEDLAAKLGTDFASCHQAAPGAYSKT